MTINEYMNNLTLESMSVANEMACDAMLCDFYSSDSEEEEVAAYESVDLAFDDDDVAAGYSAEPATEAGFFKTLGNKFKSMIETIKGWFEKVASTIKGWITKFADRIKTKIVQFKEKSNAKKIAGINADAEFAMDDLNKRETELKKKMEELGKQLSTETNASKKQQINKELLKVKTQLEALGSKGQDIVDNRAIALGKVYAQSISDGVKKAENAFKIAVKDQNTCENILIKIMNTKVSPKNKKSALVDDKLDFDDNGSFAGFVGDNKAAMSALKKVKGAEGMRRDLEKMLDDLDKVSANVADGVSAANEAYGKFNEACGSETIKLKVMQAVKFRLPSAELVNKASFMAKECDQLAKETAALSKLFGNEPAEDSNEKDKRPEIAKALSAFSKVASKLVQIANSYLQIANKGEVAAIYSDSFSN